MGKKRRAYQKINAVRLKQEGARKRKETWKILIASLQDRSDVITYDYVRKLFACSKDESYKIVNQFVHLGYLLSHGKGREFKVDWDQVDNFPLLEDE